MKPMMCFWILTRGRGQANTCPSLCAIVLLCKLYVVGAKVLNLINSRQVTAGGYGSEWWREVSRGDSYGSRVCKLLQLDWQMSHLNLKGIKKNMSRYVLLTHTHALYFQTSQKKKKTLPDIKHFLLFNWNLEYTQCALKHFRYC